MAKKKSLVAEQLRYALLDLVAEGIMEHTDRHRRNAEGRLRPLYDLTDWGRRIRQEMERCPDVDPMVISRSLRAEGLGPSMSASEWDRWFAMETDDAG